MVDLIVEENGKKRLKSDVDFVYEVMKTKNSKDKWAVVEMLLNRWIKQTPEEFAAIKMQIGDQKELLVDKEFGQTLGGKDMERRFTLVFPFKLQQMLRAVYAEEELQFDSKFYSEFAKRFPRFKIAQKV